MTVLAWFRDRFRVSRDRSAAGFTLVELLIVVAIVGLIAALLIPNLIDALQKAKQKRTMSDMKHTGTAWFSWLTDQVGAAAAGQVNVELDWTTFTERPFGELRDDLIPQYSSEVPATDAWGQLFEFGATPSMESAMPIGIRSSAGDGVFDDDSYVAGPFIATDYDQDIVWAGGFFIRWPSGLGT